MLVYGTGEDLIKSHSLKDKKVRGETPQKLDRREEPPY